MKPENALHAYVSAFVEELSSAGLRQVCMCPGSRSTPLAMLLEAHPAIEVWMHLDERSCAFFALGMAKERGGPVGVLCTSGTAAANFLPAAVEALHARVPLLLLTADRPPELQNAGANQTIDQVELYGKQVKWFSQAPLPEASPQALRSIRRLASQSISTAVSQPPGPVHLNFPFREPLIPIPQERPADRRLLEGFSDSLDRSSALVRISTEVKSSASISFGRAELDDAAVRSLASYLIKSQGGIIICGPQTDSGFPQAVANLARSLNSPILADPLSQVRCGPHDRSPLIDSYDAFLRTPEVADSLASDVILRFGAVPRSRPLMEYLQCQACRHIVVSPSPPCPDPDATATDIIYAQPSAFCEALSKSVDVLRTPQAPNLRPQAWIRINQLTRQAISTYFDSLSELFEGKVFAELDTLLPEEAILFVGNSMPVRDLETFFPSSRKKIRFHANYGASGIDGVTSTALGAASVGDMPAFLVTGDLSFFHDLNGLLPAKLHRVNLTVVLLNNDGGGIFSFLPQASHPSQFETLFGTPHGINFQPVVEMFGGSYHRVEDWDDFRASLAEPSSGLRVFEIRTDRTRNVELHREVWKVVASALELVVVT